MTRAWHVIADGGYVEGPFLAKWHAEMMLDLGPGTQLAPGAWMYSPHGRPVYVGRIEPLDELGLWPTASSSR